MEAEESQNSYDLGEGKRKQMEKLYGEKKSNGRVRKFACCSGGGEVGDGETKKKKYPWERESWVAFQEEKEKMCGERMETEGGLRGVERKEGKWIGAFRDNNSGNSSITGRNVEGYNCYTLGR